MESPAAVTNSHKALKWFAFVLLALLLLWPLTFGMVWLLNRGYTWLDPTRFPFSESRIHAILQSVAPEAPEPQKGAALSRA